MKVYIGFDDTDTVDSEMGTGKLVRRFEALLPEGCSLWGVVRQQLLVDDRIPYTSHNSAACGVVLLREPSQGEELLERAHGATAGTTTTTPTAIVTTHRRSATRRRSVSTARREGSIGSTSLSYGTP